MTKITRSKAELIRHFNRSGLCNPYAAARRWLLIDTAAGHIAVKHCVGKQTAPQTAPLTGLESWPSPRGRRTFSWTAIRVRVPPVLLVAALIPLNAKPGGPTDGASVQHGRPQPLEVVGIKRRAHESCGFPQQRLPKGSIGKLQDRLRRSGIHIFAVFRISMARLTATIRRHNCFSILTFAM